MLSQQRQDWLWNNAARLFREKARLFSQRRQRLEAWSLHHPCRQQTFPTNECQLGYQGVGR